MTVHDFDRDAAWADRLEAHRFWEQFWRRVYPHVVGVHRVRTADYQRAGVDRVLELPGRRLLVEEKERKRHWSDVLLEIWSRPGVPGWAVDERKITDVLAYATPKRVCVFDYPVLRGVVRARHGAWPGCRRVLAQNHRYQTESVAVPLSQLLAAYGLARWPDEPDPLSRSRRECLYRREQGRQLSLF